MTPHLDRIMVVQTPTHELCAGDIVAFGLEAIPPRVWLVQSIRRRKTRIHITWILPSSDLTRSLEGHVGNVRPWSASYARDTLHRRIPKVVARLARRRAARTGMQPLGPA